MAKTLTVQQFFKMFPTDDVCLDHLFKERFGTDCACPKCGLVGSFRKLSKLPAYTCNCGHHIHPMVGTPFERSSTSLQKWFYAMYLFTTSRHGVPAKELQRQLGVTYKTAWRMGHEIRKYMAMIDGTPPLSGKVEADETYVGGVKKGRGGRGLSHKTVVFGMLEKGGDVVTQIVPSAGHKVLNPILAQHVAEGSTLHTDEWSGYNRVYQVKLARQKVNHVSGEYVRGDVHTNGIEGFWSQIKRSIQGTHIHVSRQHLAKYLGEFEYRYNMRKTPELMFSRLLASF